MNGKRKQTILAVDDTIANIDVVKGVLAQDYLVQAAPSGQIALKIIEKKMPDLILLDIMMPEMDGYEVCRRIKSAPEVANIPVIFLSSKGEIADITKGFSLGAVDYITKPIEPEILKSRISAHLSIKRSRQNLSDQIDMLMENACLREDVERMTRHDIKTPLSSIASQVNLLLIDSQFTSEQQDQFKMIEESTNQALTMVNNSLDIYKMEIGKYKLKPISVNVMASMEKVIIDLNELATSSSVSIRLKEYKKSITVQGENFLCYAIFSNLLKNAIEASPKDSEVTIAIENEDCNVAIRIYNQGVIPLSIRSNLFEKYVTANKQDGNGIGTYSAKLMTRVQRGKIDFITTNEDSTVFTITLPRYDEK
jgi:DNA-binding response OmpR family regulator